MPIDATAMVGGSRRRSSEGMGGGLREGGKGRGDFVWWFAAVLGGVGGWLVGEIGRRRLVCGMVMLVVGGV